MKGDAKKEGVMSMNGTEDVHCSAAMSFSESLWDKSWTGVKTDGQK